MDRSRRRKIITVQSNYDIVLVMLVVLLSVFGLIMIYSTSSYNAAKYYNDPKLYFNRQALFLMIGFALMLVVSFIDYRVYFKPFLFKLPLVVYYYLLCLGLQVAVVFTGHEAGGSSRWLDIPGLPQFQPSELSKICVILFSTYMIGKIGAKINHFWGYARVLGVMAPIIGLVTWQNLSTGIIMAGILTVICFVVCRNKRYFFFVFIFLVLAGVVFIVSSEYRLERVLTWWDADNLDPSSQIVQGLYAIASGGLWGKGLGQSSQKMGYIPEVHTDMIFTIICEELGIFGAIILLAVVLMLLWRLLIIAINAPDTCGTLIATGALTHIALQVLLNVAVVTNSIPATGVPFPFISYGGSSLLMLMLEIGLVLSVSKYTKKEEPADDAVDESDGRQVEYEN